jgi:hypothetical protein
VAKRIQEFKDSKIQGFKNSKDSEVSSEKTEVRSKK